jgi:hypothetical protein
MHSLKRAFVSSENKNIKSSPQQKATPPSCDRDVAIVNRDGPLWRIKKANQGPFEQCQAV